MLLVTTQEAVEGKQNITMNLPHTHNNGAHHDAKSNGHQKQSHDGPAGGGKLIVLTAPLTETIDHAGYFIQMGMASMPIWMEGVLNRKYTQWRNVEINDDGSAKYMPA